MKKNITTQELENVKAIADLYGYKAARKLAKALDFTPKSIIRADDIMLALDVALALYNPKDLGLYGKNKEAMEELCKSWNMASSGFIGKKFGHAKPDGLI